MRSKSFVLYLKIIVLLFKTVPTLRYIIRKTTNSVVFKIYRYAIAQYNKVILKVKFLFLVNRKRTIYRGQTGKNKHTKIRYLH